MISMQSTHSRRTMQPEKELNKRENELFTMAFLLGSQHPLHGFARFAARFLKLCRFGVTPSCRDRIEWLILAFVTPQRYRNNNNRLYCLVNASSSSVQLHVARLRFF